MVLLLAVVAGLAVGLGWSLRQKVRYEAPVLHHLWLVFFAFLMQYLVIYLPVHGKLPRWVIVLGLIVSQLLLVGFALVNRSNQGMKVLMIGSVLNVLVMVANGGFMPISPQTAGRLVAPNILADVPIGARFGAKDVLLPAEYTHLEWLSDRFLPPAWMPYQVAFSLGDIFIAAGAFWLLARQKNIEQGYNP